MKKETFIKMEYLLPAMKIVALRASAVLCVSNGLQDYDVDEEEEVE